MPNIDVTVLFIICFFVGIFIDLYITPLKLGLFEDIFIPCFIGHQEKPLLLRILCAVEDVYVNIQLPNRNGTVTTVFWPPKVTEEFDITFPEFENEYLQCIGGEDDVQVTKYIAHKTIQHFIYLLKNIK